MIGRKPPIRAAIWSLVATLAVGLVAGGGAAAPAAELSGIPRVIDGDTLELAGHRIRLYGIDAPEPGQTCRLGRRAYDCGLVARAALLDLTAGVTVVCRLLDSGAAAGPEKARLGRCFAEGYDLSEGMAYAGWALARPGVSKRYVALEEDARAAGRGLWKGRFVEAEPIQRGERFDTGGLPSP